MSKTLTWEYLSPVHITRVQSSDATGTRKILKEADKESGSGYFANWNEEQSQIMLDLFFHALRFAKTQNMTSEKVSTLISLIYHTHVDSVAAKATMQESYAIMQSYLISHSVHRPPYSAAIFAVDDVKHINDYLLSTYYRHYKLYHFVFTERNLANVSTSIVGAENEMPPIAQPLSKAIPLAQWEANKAENERKEEEEARQRKEEEDNAAREAARAAAEAAANGPPMSAGLKAQLSAIEKQVAGMSSERLDALEAKVQALESRQAELNKPSSAVGKSAPRRK